MLAAKSNHLSCVKLLLHHGALLNLRDKDGLTALTLAIRSGSRDTAEILAETIQGHSMSSRNFYFGSFSNQGGLHPNSFNQAANGAASADNAIDNFATPSAQVFGLAASPQQMAQEEFDKSTNFLVAVSEQLRRYILLGKQAAYDGSQSSSLESSRMDLKPLSTSASSLGTPLSSIPRSSSSYFNSLASMQSNNSPYSLADSSPLPSIVSPAPPSGISKREPMVNNTTPTAAAATAFRATHMNGTNNQPSIPSIAIKQPIPPSSSSTDSTGSASFNLHSSPLIDPSYSSHLPRLPSMSPTSNGGVGVNGDLWSFMPITDSNSSSE